MPKITIAHKIKKAREMILFKKYIEAKELILKKVEEGIYFALFSLTFLGRQSYFSFFFFYEVK